VVLGKSQANRRGEEITSLVVGFDEKITSEELTRIVAVVVVVFLFFLDVGFGRGEKRQIGMGNAERQWGEKVVLLYDGAKAMGVRHLAEALVPGSSSSSSSLKREYVSSLYF
jgi:hypothetical protein